MTRMIRTLLLVLIAAISVTAMTSTADASTKKSCKLPNGMILEHGGELFEEDSPGYNVHTCDNGRLCVTAVLSRTFRVRVCWYSPAALASTGSTAPSITQMSR